MQTRACVQNYDNGDVQGFLYIDEGMGESLVTTSPRYATGTPQASNFSMSGTSGNVSVVAEVSVVDSEVVFTITVGMSTASILTRTLVSSAASC